MLFRSKESSVLRNTGRYFSKAASENELDVFYLLAHALYESGYGQSEIAVKHNNLFGIGGFYADSIEDGILFGAKWLSEHYINSPKYEQDTLRKMRFNNGVHQISMDHEFDIKVAQIMENLVELYNELKEDVDAFEFFQKQNKKDLKCFSLENNNGSISISAEGMTIEGATWKHQESKENDDSNQLVEFLYNLQTEVSEIKESLADRETTVTINNNSSDISDSEKLINGIYNALKQSEKKKGLS